MKIQIWYEGQTAELDLLDFEEIITLRESERGGIALRPYPIHPTVPIVPNSATGWCTKMDRSTDEPLR